MARIHNNTVLLWYAPVIISTKKKKNEAKLNKHPDFDKIGSSKKKTGSELRLRVNHQCFMCRRFHLEEDSNVYDGLNAYVVYLSLTKLKLHSSGDGCTKYQT